MFGGSTSNEGVWGFAALAQGVKGLGLGPGDVGGSVKPADFGGWRSKDDGEPDSPEGKGAATDVPVVEEAQVGRKADYQECNFMAGGVAKDFARRWRYLQSQCNQFTKQKGIMQQMENSQMIQLKGRCLSTRDSSSGGVLRPPHRFEEDISS